jgi:hypothetical protein
MSGITIHANAIKDTDLKLDFYPHAALLIGKIYARNCVENILRKLFAATSPLAAFLTSDRSPMAVAAISAVV